MSEFEIFNGDSKNVLKEFKKDNILLVYVILVAVFIGVLVASFMYFYNQTQNSDTIQSGIFIKGVNVSGLKKDEAIALISNELKNQMNDHLTLKYKNHEFYIDIEQIEAKFDIEASVNFAFKVAKTGNMIQNVQEYISVLMTHINIEPILTYNKEALEKYLQTIESNLPDQLVQSSYYIEDDELIITNGINGAGIIMQEAENIIISAIQDISYSNRYIDIPTYVKYPEAIQVETIHNDIFREAKNAYFTTEPYAVFAEVVGVDFNVQEMKNKIQDNPEAEEYVISLDYTKPEVTVNDLGMEAFPNLLANYSTKYNTKDVDRTTNLRLASNKINGTVIMPGEEFSYNKIVGKRTIAAGYKEAPIYQDGQVVSGLGGGICQVTTTLYNAVIGANLKITSRRNHMFVPSYAIPGNDATVAWGSTDFKFKNNRDYPIKIESSVSNGVAKISIYGLQTDEDYDNIRIESKTIKSTSTSLVVDAYKVYIKDGQIVKKEKISRDTYKKH